MIRKVGKSSTLIGQVVNTYSDSTTDGYSCDYANKAFGGKVLWTNPNPDSAFAAQTITLSSSDYDMLLWIFRTGTSNDAIQMPLYTIKGFGGVHDWASSSVEDRNKRLITYNTDTSYSIGENTSGNASRDILLYVIGYKTGLFS